MSVGSIAYPLPNQRRFGSTSLTTTFHISNRHDNEFLASIAAIGSTRTGRKLIARCAARGRDSEKAARKTTHAPKNAANPTAYLVLCNFSAKNCTESVTIGIKIAERKPESMPNPKPNNKSPSRHGLLGCNIPLIPHRSKLNIQIAVHALLNPV